jgi:perosamine synthetase
MPPYETRFAAVVGEGFQAFSFWKARIALYAILKALRLKERDEVLLPGYTCVVVPNAVRYTGANPIYADIASGHYNLDPVSVERRITPRTRAIIVQHTYGIPVDIGMLQALAGQHQLFLIEDCAHVLLGSHHQGRPLGSFGTAAFFSFQWSKPYTTGLGGMAVTQDRELGERLAAIHQKFREPPIRQRLQVHMQYRLYKRFFGPRLYWSAQELLHTFSKLGLFVGSSSTAELIGTMPADIDWRMSRFQQQAGVTRIGALSENAQQRQRLARYYTDALQQHGWPVDDRLNSDALTLLRYPLRVANKRHILEASRRAHVEMGSWFETPLHPLLLRDHPLMTYQPGSCPVAERTAAHVINLPLHDRITQSNAERIMHFILSHASPTHSHD